MTKQLPFPLKEDSIYATYDISAKDTLVGQVLTPLQKAVLKNQLASFAEDKVNLVYTVASSDSEGDRIAHIQREAELMGQINLIRYMLELSESAEQAILGNMQ